MFITDAQVHIWTWNTPERPWPVEDPPHTPHRPVPFTKHDLLREMDAAGVSRAVLVPPSWEGDRVDIVLDAAQSHPDRFGVMGRIDLSAPGARKEITDCRKNGMLGLRFSFRIQPDGQEDWVWETAQKAGIPLMVVASNQLAAVDKVAQRYPDLKLVIDHMAIPRRTKDEKAFGHFDQLLPLAKRPNVAVKTSSLPSYTTSTYPFTILHPYIRKVYDAFGPKRMFWGSDLSKLPCPYKQAITMFTEELKWLTEEDKEWIMGRGVCEWIGWKMPK